MDCFDPTIYISITCGCLINLKNARSRGIYRLFVCKLSANLREGIVNTKNEISQVGLIIRRSRDRRVKNRSARSERNGVTRVNKSPLFGGRKGLFICHPIEKQESEIFHVPKWNKIPPEK